MRRGVGVHVSWLFFLFFFFSVLFVSSCNFGHRSFFFRPLLSLSLIPSIDPPGPRPRAGRAAARGTPPPLGRTRRRTGCR
ncbi:hypothetical protein GGR56DRAFT_631088 [Xylariaceae sp. FL0804]|nr:hypothetical protein GGR56DRAFT_631088 [Xylariaceae sp. FL0804]